MNDKPNLKDFLEIVNSDEFQSFVENYRHENSHQKNWNYRHPETFKQSQEKYEKSEKGIEARKRVKYNRHKRMVEAQADTDYEEKELIREFYSNCPEGYEVDHIMPISKGGKHKLHNLQYITPEENRKKASRLYYKLKRKI